MYQNGHSSATRPHHQQHHGRLPITVVAIPAVTLVGSRLVVGDSSSTSSREYTPLKVVGDGSFGTVWLCDWHGLLPPNTRLSPMQCGAGARPEWAGKRLVAVKRMKKRWEGGWDECKKLKELEALRAITPHENIIPLYDFFLLPSSKELYFVFESMEGNLYQLIKSRKNRPLAGGLVASIFKQIVSGLDHIHRSGYFHRDMKPENLLVTTTGISDYSPVSPIAPPNAPNEKDVVVILKLADFGLARETQSRPPYTEYVSTRWYRAPEVLLHSRDYSNPVDMWALGTIMVELVNLKPLFPGQGEIDQVMRICQFLGDPSNEYGVDANGKSLGGGPWAKGVKMAGKVGFTFPKHTPVPIETLFEPSVPRSLVDCIRDLLKYDPQLRLTSQDCVHHRYLAETAHSIPPSAPPPLQITTSVSPTQSHAQSLRNGRSHGTSLHHVSSPPSAITSVSPRSVPPSHSNSPANSVLPIHTNGGLVPELITAPQRTPFYQRQAASVAMHDADMSDLDHSLMAADVYSNDIDSTWQHPSPHDASWDPPSPYESTASASTPRIPEEELSRSIYHDPLPEPNRREGHDVNGNAQTKGGKSGSIGKKRGWGFGSMFGGHDKQLPPVDELLAHSISTPSLKRSQTGSTDSHSLPDISPTAQLPPSVVVTSEAEQKKFNKKEAERIALEAEKQKRILAEKTQRERARRVVMKNKLLLKDNAEQSHLEKLSAHRSFLDQDPHPNGGRKGKQPMYPSTIAAAGGRYGHGASSANVSTTGISIEPPPSSWNDPEGIRRMSDQTDHRGHKARRRNMDDDHSMSSSDMQSTNRLSMLSFATGESTASDPMPNSRMRHHHNRYGISRATSYSSLRAPTASSGLSGRSSTSVDGQLANEFGRLDTLESQAGSPPPQMSDLSLSPSTPGQHWPQEMGNGSPYSSHQQQQQASVQRRNPPAHIQLPGVSSFDNMHQMRGPPSALSPFDYGTGSNPSSPGGVSPQMHSMFQLPPLPQSSQPLPPFSSLPTVAEQHPELSPMLPPIQDIVLSDSPG